MKISDIKECIARMRNIYSFNDEDTDLRLDRNARCKTDCMVIINTRDKENDVYITLETTRREV